MNRTAGVINVSKGKAVHGAFHSPHTWKMKSLEGRESDDAAADAIVKHAE